METPGRIAELERKFGENPRRYFAALANEYRKNGEFERAIELCERHLAEQRNHLSGYVVLAQSLVEAGRDKDAWEPLHAALDLDPENFIALRLLGELSAAAGDADQARGYYFRALEIEPRSEQILGGLKALSAQRADAAAQTTDRPATAGEPSLAEAAEAAAEPVAEPLPVWGNVEVERAPASDALEAKPAEEELPWLAPRDESEEPAAAETTEPETVAAATEDVWRGWELPADAEVRAEPEGHAVVEEGPVVEEERIVVEESAAEWSVEPAETAETVEDVVAGEHLPNFSLSDEFPVPAPRAAPPPATDAPQHPDIEERAESRPTLVSETMVELYLAQGHTAFAVEALRDLVAARPGDERLRERLAELERSSAGPPRETVRDLFAKLGRGRSRSKEAAVALAGAFAQSDAAGGPLASLFGMDAAPSVPADDALAAALDDSHADIPDSAAFERWLGELRRP